jgi:hypothetical protein
MMFCSNCGAELGSVKFCPNCGTIALNSDTEKSSVQSSDSLFESKRTDENKKVHARKWVSLAIIIGLILFAASQGKTLTGLLFGGELGVVTLDSTKAEKYLESAVLEQAGEEVTAWCPNPLEGKVGEVRQCQVTDSTGKTYLVDITIQNTNGDISWRIQN